MSGGIAEQLFEQRCKKLGVSCSRIAPSDGPTADFQVQAGGTDFICEVKRIDMNEQDRAEIENMRIGKATGRLVPNRLRKKLKDVSRQLQNAAASGLPTMLVVHDNTPLKMYTDHHDVITSMFGEERVALRVLPDDPSADPDVSDPFFGGNRAFTPRHNTSISVLAILDGDPSEPGGLHLYFNPYAAVAMPASVAIDLEASVQLPPGADSVRL